MKTDYDLKRCYICGEYSANSVDHVPPKNLFLKKGSNLITVPAHIECNKKCSKDDEYFRYCILTPALWESDYAKKLWDKKISKSIHRQESQAFKQYLNNQLITLPIETSAGIYLGKADAATLDAARILRVANRIGRGIYYKHTKNILPVSTKLQTDWMHPKIQIVREQMEKEGQFHIINDEVFKYYWEQFNDKGVQKVHMWLTFFNCVDFWAVTI